MTRQSIFRLLVIRSGGEIDHEEVDEVNLEDEVVAAEVVVVAMVRE